MKDKITKITIEKVKGEYIVDVFHKDGSSSSQWANSLETALLLIHNECHPMKGFVDIQKMDDADMAFIDNLVKQAFMHIGGIAKYFITNFYVSPPKERDK